MDIAYKSWLDIGYVSCTRACTGTGHELGHRLYTSCRSRGVVMTNIYDFDNDTAYKLSSDNGMWTVTKPIPESQKGEPVFLAAFCVQGNHKISELESWISSLEENKVLNVEEKEWKTDVTVFLERQAYLCTMTTTVTRRTALSPYCEDDTQRIDCPLVPHTAWITCGSNRLIRYSFENYTQKFNQSAIQLPQKLEDVVTTKPHETSKPVQDPRAHCYSEVKYTARATHA
ncbi:hypothetical protein V5799_018425 [Amblyomma americanum]|uniref:Uncharacterized protein n=1 Tax=Amblyomma americanum TaxID=6943 RepID=A0AAQ4EZB1_AMBAM